jgi:tryptophan synthase alpha subunit
MKTRIWGSYRKRVLFHINEMCKHAMNPACYGFDIDEEMYCAENIMVAQFNMNQVVIYFDIHNRKHAQHFNKISAK